MKALPMTMLLAVFAAPLSAAATGDPPKKPAATATTLSATPPAPQDSPLVRAAKATGRLHKKPAMVITNETLVRSGGHLSFGTTASTTPLPAALPHVAAAPATSLPASQPEGNADDKVRKERAVRSAADYSGESIEARTDDPAAQERQMNPPPETKKPPRS